MPIIVLAVSEQWNPGIRYSEWKQKWYQILDLANVAMDPWPNLRCVHHFLTIMKYRFCCTCVCADSSQSYELRPTTTLEESEWDSRFPIFRWSGGSLNRKPTFGVRNNCECKLGWDFKLTLPIAFCIHQTLIKKCHTLLRNEALGPWEFCSYGKCL